MNNDSWGSLFFVVLVGSLVLVPIYLRNRLLARQLDVLAIAMQQGVAPERVRESLLLRREEGDVNGNWKAGLILTALGWGVLPLSLLALFASAAQNKADAGSMFGLLPGIACLVLGARLHRIHRAVVGDVVRRGEAVATDAVASARAAE
jgi:hypothetical protein